MKTRNPFNGSITLLPVCKGLYLLKRMLSLFIPLVIFLSSCKKNDYKEELTLPEILSIDPSNNAPGVPIDGKITVFFNKFMDSVIYPTTFILKQGNEIIPGTLIYNEMSVVFTPHIDLDINSTFTAAIITGVKNSKGQAITTNYNWNFSTGGSYHYHINQQSDAVTDFIRDGSKMIQIGDYIYSFGGWTASPEKSYNDVYRSYGDLSQWEKRTEAPWHGRHTFGLAKIDNTTYVFGGDYLNTVFDVWSSNDGENWIQKASTLDPVIGTRILYGYCAHNNNLFILGGEPGLDPNAQQYGDVWNSSDGVAWTQLTTNKTFLGKNISGCVTSFSGRIWVLGGGIYDHSDPAVKWQNSVYSSADGVTWQQEADAPWAGRQYADVCVWDNKLWVIGGYGNSGNLNDIWYMKKDGTWIQFDTPVEYSGRHATAVAVYDNKLAITCGNYHNDCWVIEKLPF